MSLPAEDDFLFSCLFKSNAVKYLVALLRLQSISCQCGAIGSALDAMRLQRLQSFMLSGAQLWRSQTSHCLGYSEYGVYMGIQYTGKPVKRPSIVKKKNVNHQMHSHVFLYPNMFNKQLNNH